MASIPAPQSESELLERAYSLVGCTFGELAKILGHTIPAYAARSKGTLGQLIECALGATSGSLPQPDFNHLGIELKTIPISEKGVPQESTYICSAPLSNPERKWRQSRVYHKMAHILWIPYLDTPKIEDRRICTPFLWHMPSDIEAILRKDWGELTEYIHLGQVEQLSAHLGTYLQLRPKAANSKTFIPILNHLGETISIVPKGFYLRSQATKLILQHYA